ncbi:MAG: CehA/McbA family metallohydrolase [Candidatus Marinimicrobia bacterium]|nr:CehA/McbA family metallohydrolase [Candidatus Neomarinimicrobiota bacterium]
MKHSPALIPGQEGKRNLDQTDEMIAERRWQRPLAYARFVVEDLARRVETSRRDFPWRFFRGDCHAHTQHSDGIGQVAEMAEMAQAAGLDFQFITDHWGLTQAVECRRAGLWVGQEPITEHHHLGILGLKETFVPLNDLRRDFRSVKKRGGIPFIPHPAGWWPSRVYTDAQRQALYELPDPFLMEIINGANQTGTAFDYTDAAAVALWDEMLMSGRRVHAMGNTDAHAPHGVGSVWNGVLAPRCDEAAILRALAAGRVFVSEAPLLWLQVGTTGMGQRLRAGTPTGPLRCRVVDAEGLLRVRLVADGKVRRTWHPDGKPVLDVVGAVPNRVRKYVRVEAIAMDGRRGYTNPVYFPVPPPSSRLSAPT